MPLKLQLIMYYEFSDFYKRDVSFVYEEKNNEISWLNLMEGNYLNPQNPLIYTVDKIDSYIDRYDLLPTIGIPLVSKKWRDTFIDLEGKDFQLLDVVIKDEKGNKNSNFFALKILHILPCLDKKKSIFEVDEDGYDIIKCYITPGSLQSYSIVMMEEDTSYIIVTDGFKKRCDEAHLKGFDFIEEGN